MKNFVLSFGLVLCAVGLFAQAEVQYSQFIFNKLAFNPGYAGSKDALTLGAIYRHQWQGIDGAPRTLSAYAHAPFRDGRSGAALSLTSDRIGLVMSNYVDLSYAYRIPLGEGKLSIGLQARFANSMADWSKLELITPDDNSIPEQDGARHGVNFGTGLYYNTKNYYIGLSAPQFLRNKLYTDANVQSAAVLNAYYLMGGLVTRVSENVVFKPAMMISYSPNAPFELDLNASFQFMNAFWLGATYRLGDSVDAVMQFQLSPSLKLGLATDFTLTELRDYTDGSFEMWLEYVFVKETDGVRNPRWF